MKTYHIAKENSILNKFLSEIRCVNKQKDRMRFRKNIERIGEILGYELSKKLSYKKHEITTPLGTKQIDLHSNELVLCSILRAGLSLHTGVLNYFDDADNSFISAYRRHLNKDEFEIVVEYFASPDINGKTLVLIDPMLATGRSLVAVYEGIKKHGTPKDIHIVSAIGSVDGVNYIKKHYPENTTLWIADIDEKLNNNGYIVPGLGDVGDLAFGTKL